MPKKFKLEPKVYELNFEDDDLYGFVCRMRGISLEKFVEASNLEVALGTPEGRTPENIEKQFTFIADLLLEWNLVSEDDKDVPATYDELKKLDFSIVMRILKGYMQAVSSVPKDSSETSNSGGTSPERSLGLASVSKSQAS